MIEGIPLAYIQFIIILAPESASLSRVTRGLSTIYKSFSHACCCDRTSGSVIDSQERSVEAGREEVQMYILRQGVQSERA